jgi:hypothetical protein
MSGLYGRTAARSFPAQVDPWLPETSITKTEFQPLYIILNLAIFYNIFKQGE